VSVTLIAESLLLSLAGTGIAYLAWAIWCVWRFRPGGEAHPSYRPALTILKPLCGAYPDLLDCLRSFCRQDCPGLQIVFGVADAADPALPIVRPIMAEFPARDIVIVVDPTQHGANRKVSNLINMMPLAKHGILIVCDSDVRISENCLGALVRPLADPTVGARFRSVITFNTDRAPANRRNSKSRRPGLSCQNVDAQF